MRYIKDVAASGEWKAIALVGVLHMIHPHGLIILPYSALLPQGSQINNDDRTPSCQIGPRKARVMGGSKQRLGVARMHLHDLKEDNGVRSSASDKPYKVVPPNYRML